MRAVLSVILVAITATTLHGQRLAPIRLSHAHGVDPSVAVRGTNAVVETRCLLTVSPEAPKALGSLRAGLPGQVVSGLVGMVVTFAVVAGVTVLATPESGGGLGAGARMASPAIMALPLGSAIGVQAHGRRHGMQAPFRSTFGGALLGMLPLPISPLTSPVTSPLGGAIAFNRNRQPIVAL